MGCTTRTSCSNLQMAPDGHKAAAEDAEWAETDAVDAIEFAQSATEDAQYAVLEAVRARRKADIAAAAM